MWARSPTAGADDEAQLQELHFEAVIDVAQATVDHDASQASNNFYVIVWTTSGAQWVRKLGLWAAVSDVTAQQLVQGQSCPNGLNGPATTAGYSKTCSCSLDNAQVCSYAEATFGWLGVNNGGFTAVGPDSAANEYYAEFGSLVPLAVGGQNVPVDSSGIPEPCASSIFTYGGGPCSIGQGMTFLAVADIEHGTGSCSGETPAPSAPVRAASFTYVTPLTDNLVTHQLGWDHPPAPEAIQVH
jgi:hypothetical protein